MADDAYATIKKIINEVSSRQFVYVVDEPDDDETIDEELGGYPISYDAFDITIEDKIVRFKVSPTLFGIPDHHVVAARIDATENLLFELCVTAREELAKQGLSGYQVHTPEVEMD